MKSKWFMLLAMSIPLMTLGDIASPPSIHRLRRIGNNIDVVSGNVHNDCMDLLIPVLLMFLGLCILVVFNRWKKLRPAIEGAGKKFVINIIKFTVWCVVLVALCRFAEEIDFAFPDNEGVILGVFLFAMVWGLVDVFGRRWSIIIMCSVIIGGLWVLNISGFSHLLWQAMLGEGRIIYVAEPGWHYPDKVPDSDRKAVMAIMTDDLLADLQKAIDEDGYPIMLGPIMSGLYPREEHPNTSVVPQYYREKLRKEGELGEMEELREKKVQALLSVLKSREQLAARCKGVPIEWLVDRLRFKAIDYVEPVEDVIDRYLRSNRVQ